MRTCAKARRELSAAWDGKPSAGLEAARRHATECPACRDWAGGLGRLAAMAGAATAAPVPDLTGMLLAGYRESRRVPEPRPWLRWALVLVAVAQLALALPDLLGTGHGADAHAHRDLSAWDAAFAVGLLYAARRPDRAVGLLPFAVALAGVLAFSAFADIRTGRVPSVTEIPHLLAVTGLALLWRMTRPRPPHSRHPRSTARTA